MARVDVTIPRMLADVVGGQRRFAVDGDTVDGALAALVERHPELAVHLFDESGAMRPHVTCFHNGVSVAAGPVPTADGDALVILQAVSGG